MDEEGMLNINVFKQLIKQFEICPEILFFETRFNAQLLTFASYKSDQEATTIDALRMRGLVVSNLRLETKNSWFKSGCQLCAEVSSLQSLPG